MTVDEIINPDPALYIAVLEAIKSSNNNTLKALMERNSLNVNSFLRYKRSILHLAIEFNKIQVVQYLIEQGADLTIQDGYGCTPLYYAVKCGYYNIVLMLIGAGARE